MKRLFLLVVLGLGSISLGQSAPPTTPDVSQLSRADLELLCHNLFLKVDELKSRVDDAESQVTRDKQTIAMLNARLQDTGGRPVSTSSAMPDMTPAPAAPAVPDPNVHNTLAKLAAAGEPVRLAEISKLRSVPPNSPQYSDAGSKCEFLFTVPNRLVPPLGPDATIGVLQPFMVQQIIDDNNMLIHWSGSDNTFWLSGVDTRGKIDGQIGYGPMGIFEISGTKMYTTVWGSSHTIPMVTRVTGVDEWLEQSHGYVVLKLPHP